MPKDLYEIISLLAAGGIIESKEITEDELADRVVEARMRRKRTQLPGSLGSIPAPGRA